MTERSIPIVYLRGSAFERGVQHGQAFAKRIAGLIADLKATHGQGAYSEARKFAERSLARLDGGASQIKAELRGIAEGSRCDLLDVYLNVGFEFFAAKPTSGCSAVAARTENGAIIGQNWDAPTDAAADLVIFVHTATAGTVERVFVSSVGGLGWVGCNAAGLALINNDLMLDSSVDGLPSQVVRRLALDESDVEAALRSMAGLPHMGGRSYLLGDASGVVVGLEVSPEAGVHVLENRDLVLHTNNALLPATASRQDEQALQSVYPSSRNRLVALRLAAAAGMQSVEALMAVLRDRRGAPNSVSKSPSPEEETETAFSVIFDCAGRQVHVCAGPPCEGVYHRIALDTLAPTALA